MSDVPSRTARVLVASDDEDDRFLPEGPRVVTLDGREALVWVNIQTAADATRGAVHAHYFDDGEAGVWNLPDRPGFVLPTDRPGTLLVGMGKRLGLLDLETNDFQTLATIPDDNPRTIINDGEAVPGGRAVVFGTKDVRFADPVAGLYLFTLGDNAVSPLAGGQTCSNGKVFARDAGGLVLFDIDTPTRTVGRYRLDLVGRTATFEGVALDLSGQPGFPDGMRAADSGSVIVAFYDPEPHERGRAVRFDLATGRELAEWTTPGAPRVTCPCLVRRPDGVKLVLTTATEGMPGDHAELCPNAGFLFVADTDLSDFPPQEVVRLAG